MSVQPSTAPPAPPPHPATAAAAGTPAPAASGGADLAQPSCSALGDAVRIAAGLSLTAGVVHAIATVDHFSHYWLYGVFFMVVTYGQVLWGIALWRNRASARALRIGAYANVAIVAVWVLSRTVGVPIGPYTWDAEPIGLADAAATIDQLLLAAYVTVVLRPELRVVRGLRVLVGTHRVQIGMMICSASVFAGMLGGHQH
ncbi:MAG: hypothetical protein ABIM89_12295 [Mycobacteriales bacterium]